MVPKRLALYPYAEDPLAMFGVVCGMVFPVLMFPAAILFGLAELLIPELARCAAAGSQTRIRYLVKRSLRVAMLYGCFFCGLMYLLANELCIALYKNAQAGQYLSWFALVVPMLYCDAITDAMTKGLGQQKACVRYNILTSAMDVILLYLLLPRWGIGGYFFSFLVTHLLNFALSLGRLKRISGCSITWNVPILSIAATLASIWGASWVTQPVLKTVAYMLLSGSLLVLLRVLKKEDLQWVKGLVKR